MEQQENELDCDDYENIALDCAQGLAQLLLTGDGEPDTFDDIYEYVADASLMLFGWADMLQKTVLLHDESCIVQMLQAKAVLQRLTLVWRTSMDTNKVIHLIPQNREVLKALQVAALEPQIPRGFCSGLQNLN